MSKKVYVITGATSGIGKSLVEILSKDNIVYAGFRSEEKIKDINGVLENIKTFYVDYAKPETIQEALKYLNSAVEKVDTLINVAGCVVAGPVEKLSIDEVRRQFNVNVFGHLEMAQGLIDKLKGGRIINISSMASYAIFPFISPYCASKRALDIFFNSFAIENKHGIKVISIKPGVIVTPLWEKSIKENFDAMKNCDGYEKEMEFLASNARKNETKGLNVDKVVQTILDADAAKKPRLTYTVGADAFFAHMVSKLPQRIINKLIKLGLKLRMQKK